MTKENPIEKAPASFKLPWIVCEVFQALQTLQDKADFAQAVFAYVKDGKAPPPKSLAAATFFEMARKQIDLLTAQKEKLSRVRSEIGKLGGAKFAEICAKAREFEGNATPPKQTAPASQVATPAEAPLEETPEERKRRKQREASARYRAKQTPAQKKADNLRRSENRRKQREAQK